MRYNSQGNNNKYSLYIKHQMKKETYCSLYKKQLTMLIKQYLFIFQCHQYNGEEMYNTGWIKWNDWLSVRWPGVSQDTAAGNIPSCLTYWCWKNLCLSSTLISLHWRDISYWHLLRNKLPKICKNNFPQNLVATAGGTPADTECVKDLSGISWNPWKHWKGLGLVKYQLIPI